MGFQLIPGNTSQGKLKPKEVVFGWRCTGKIGGAFPCPATHSFDVGDCNVCGTPKDANHDYSIGIVGTYNKKYVLTRKTFASLQSDDSKIEYLVSGLFEGDTKTMFTQMEDAVVRNEIAGIGKIITLKDWLRILREVKVEL